MSKASGYERIVETFSAEGARYAADRLSHLKDSLESTVAPEEILEVLEDDELFTHLKWMRVPLRDISEGPESDPDRDRARKLLERVELVLAQLGTVKRAAQKRVAREVEATLSDDNLELSAALWFDRTSERTPSN